MFFGPSPMRANLLTKVRGCWQISQTRSGSRTLDESVLATASISMAFRRRSSRRTLTGIPSACLRKLIASCLERYSNFGDCFSMVLLPLAWAGAQLAFSSPIDAVGRAVVPSVCARRELGAIRLSINSAGTKLGRRKRQTRTNFAVLGDSCIDHLFGDDRRGPIEIRWDLQASGACSSRRNLLGNSFSRGQRSLLLRLLSDGTKLQSPLKHF